MTRAPEKQFAAQAPQCLQAVRSYCRAPFLPRVLAPALQASNTSAAANAFVRINHQLWPNRQRFRVMAPFARHVAPLEKHCGAGSPVRLSAQTSRSPVMIPFMDSSPFRCRLHTREQGALPPGQRSPVAFRPKAKRQVLPSRRALCKYPLQLPLTGPVPEQ